MKQDLTLAVLSEANKLGLTYVFVTNVAEDFFDLAAGAKFENLEKRERPHLSLSGEGGEVLTLKDLPFSVSFIR